MRNITDTFDVFHDDDGTPLEAGFVYIGEPNTDPKTNPKAVYFDSALSVSAAQPLRTLYGRIVQANGTTAANLYIDGDYSITVEDRNNLLVTTATKVQLFATVAELAAQKAELEADINEVLSATQPGQYATLAQITAGTVPVATVRTDVYERETGSGSASGGVWVRQSSEPDLPELAKVQDDSGAWFALDPNSNYVRPSQFGALDKVVIDPATRTWFNAMTTKPKREHLRAMDDLIYKLRMTGLWGKIGFLAALCGHNKTDSLINIRTPGSGDLTEASTMAFTAGKGFTAGSDGELSTGAYEFGDVTGYTLLDAHFGVFSIDSGLQDSAPIAGAATGTNKTFITQHLTGSDFAEVSLNGDTTTTFANADSAGHIMVSRNLSTEIRIYLRGQDFASAANTTTLIPADPIRVGKATGSDGSGTVAFVHAGANLDDYEARVLWSILTEYRAKVGGVWNVGETVTAAMLDTAVDVSANTSALQAVMDFSAATDAIVRLPLETILVDDTLVISGNTQVVGRGHVSRIRADTSMTNTRPLVKVGSPGVITSNVSLVGFDADYNLDRDGFTAGGFGDDADGSAIVGVNIQDCTLQDLRGIAARKHGIDVFSEDYNRSGATGVFNQRHDLVSKNVTVIGCAGIGPGDDGVTFHGLEDSFVNNIGGMFGRATFSAANSNGVEIDDFCRNIRGGLLWGKFCHNAVEIKGHDDALAAERVNIAQIDSQHCSKVIIRHINQHPDDAGSIVGAVPSASFDVSIGVITVRDPVGVTTGDGVTAEPLWIYGGRNVSIGSALLYAGIGARQVTTNVVQIFYGARRTHFSYVLMDGFENVDDGFVYLSSATGMHTVGMISISGGPFDKAIFAGADTDLRVVIGGYAIEGSGVTGIFGYGNRVAVGAGHVTGYGTALDLSN